MSGTESLTEATGLSSNVIDKALNTRIPSDTDSPEEVNLDIEDYLSSLGVKCDSGRWDELSEEYLARRDRPILKGYTVDHAVMVAVDVCKNMNTPSPFDSGRFAQLLNLRDTCPSLFKCVVDHEAMKPYRQYLLGNQENV